MTVTGSGQFLFFVQGFCGIFNPVICCAGYDGRIKEFNLIFFAR